MNSSSGFELLRRVCPRGTPPTPSTTLRLCLDLSAESPSSANFLAETLESDHSLSLGFLILANSGVICPLDHCSTVHQAVGKLERDQTSELLWVLAVTQILQSDLHLHPRARTHLWKHSLLTAVLTAALLEVLEVQPADFGFVGGMTHDVGHILIADPAPNLSLDWHPEHDKLPTQQHYLPIEKDHCRLGESLLEYWNAPRELRESALFHHRPQEASLACRSLVCTIRLADQLAEYIDSPAAQKRLDLEDNQAWFTLIELQEWDDVPDLNQLATELLPQALLNTERLSDLLER